VRRWLRDRHLDVLHEHEPASPSLGLLACWAAIGPIVATFHASMDRSRAMTAAYGILQTALEKVTGRIAVSERARDTLVEHLGGDAVVIPNGVSIRRFAEAAPNPDWRSSAPGDLTLGFLGRIDEPRKGLPVLLQALPQVAVTLPGIRLLVAGPGDVSEARSAVPREVADRVRFLGLVSDADKARLLRSVDAYVAPNTGGESFGVILLEAMAAGTPVVASDLEAFRLVLDQGRSGRLFRSGDAASLAETVVDLLDDAAQRAALVASGRATVERYDWDHVASRILAVYETVTWTGLKVREDSRGQLFGRFTRLKDES
jgi:phosphatidylinositol alpha-mannosyltransferase